MKLSIGLKGDYSRLFRDAVVDELERRAAVTTTLIKSKEHLLEVEDDEGRPYTARLVGVEIANDDPKFVFLTDDERIIAYHAEYKGGDYWEIDDPETELRDFLSPGAYSDALYALGRKPVVDI